jgi:hypothetical protein
MPVVYHTQWTIVNTPRSRNPYLDDPSHLLFPFVIQTLDKRLERLLLYITLIFPILRGAGSFRSLRGRSYLRRGCRSSCLLLGCSCCLSFLDGFGVFDLLFGCDGCGCDSPLGYKISSGFLTVALRLTAFFFAMVLLITPWISV